MEQPLSTMQKEPITIRKSGSADGLLRVQGIPAQFKIYYEKKLILQAFITIQKMFISSDALLETERIKYKVTTLW